LKYLPQTVYLHPPLFISAQLQQGMYGKSPPGIYTTSS